MAEFVKILFSGLLWVIISEPVRKLRGVLRPGILVVAKAARRAHLRSGL